MIDLLALQNPVGRGQQNDPDDVEALDNSLREINAYVPPPEYAGSPQRYTTEPMIDGLEILQEQNGLKVDGYAAPGGPTERAVNNVLLRKPRGAGLLFEPMIALNDEVGNGRKNARTDVRNVQRALGALGYQFEDPFDDPHGFIDETTTNSIKRFQSDKDLLVDGWLAPRGETETALHDAISNLAQSSLGDWLSYAQRAAQAQAAIRGNGKRGSSNQQPTIEGQIETLEYRPGDDTAVVPLQFRTAPGSKTLPVPFSPGEGQEHEPPLPPVLLPPFLRLPPTPPDDLPVVTPFLVVPETEFRSYVEARPLREGENLDWIIIERKGNEDTRLLNQRIVNLIESVATDHRCGADHTGGSRRGDMHGKKKAGKEIEETWLRPRGAPKGTLKGGSFADITFTIRKHGRRLFINTYDVANKTLAATRREFGSAMRLLGNANRGDLLLMIPKLGPKYTLDEEGLEDLINNLLDELCEDMSEDEREKPTDLSIVEKLRRVFTGTKPRG